MIKNNSLYIFTKYQKTKAKIFIKNGNGKFFINNYPITLYFNKNIFLLYTIKKILINLNINLKYNFYIKIKGSGFDSQYKAIILLILKLFNTQNLKFKTYLKNLEFLNFNNKKKERKKYGLRKARKAPQYSKR